LVLFMKRAFCNYIFTHGSVKIFISSFYISLDEKYH